jgi:hypothetical protein
MRTVLSVLALSLVLLGAGPGLAHEFWISPARYKVEAGGPVVASLRTGTKFKGRAGPYIPEDLVRFDILLGGRTIEVTGRIGDDPALDMTVPGEGLAVIVHQTVGFFLRYTEAGKFEAFLRHKDALHVLDAHRARGLPETGFRERYRRFAKSLVAVGHGRGEDTETGMETEFVAEANPYVDELTDGFPLSLFYEGKKRAGAQVEVFARSPDGDVTVQLLRTDEEGRVLAPAQPGYEYLLDAVAFRRLDAKDPGSDAVWESLWAEFTYAVPPHR